MRILILSTHSPSWSAGLGADLSKALSAGGNEVTFISKYENPEDKTDYIPIIRKSKVKKGILKLMPEFIRDSIVAWRMKTKHPRVLSSAGLELHYPDESLPGTDVKTLLENIHGKYDLVVTLWWYNFLTSASLKAVYDRLKCPILIYSIDMAPITGGCFYFSDCRNFTHGCGNCPCLESSASNDSTHANHLLKKKNYSSADIYFAGNSWMNHWALESGLFDKEHLKNISVIINEHDFSPVPIETAKKALGLDADCFVAMARSSGEPRKGAIHVVSALKCLWKTLDDEEKQKFVLVTVGDGTLEQQLSRTGIHVRNYGKVNRKSLAELYRASDFFLSPSEDDAGPSMVNQAMMCGTPIIAFDNGTAVDVVVDNETGFKASEISTMAFFEALRKGYRSVSRSNMRIKCRKLAMETNSSQAVAKSIKEIANCKG